MVEVTQKPKARPKSAPLTEVRRYSKAEKVTFSLRPENRVICQIVEEFFPATHFLDLPDRDQQAIRELKAERDQSEGEEKRIAAELVVTDRKEARKQRKREEAEARAATKQARNVGAAIVRRTKDYSHIWPNLEFTPAAIKRMELLAKAGVLSRVEAELGRMNAAPHQVAYRDSISGTDPIAYEIAASYDYRIYFRRNGVQIRILLIGDAGDEAKRQDTALLRQKGQAAGL